MRGAWRTLAVCLAATIFATALLPAPTLDVRESVGGRRVWCAVAPAYPLTALTAHYESRNSIWGAPAVEEWVVADGITIRQVRSTPIVLEYYGIADYRMQADGTASGTPVVSRYASVRIEASPRGAQRLSTVDGALDVSGAFAEGTILIAAAAWAPRLTACRWP